MSLPKVYNRFLVSAVESHITGTSDLVLLFSTMFAAKILLVAGLAAQLALGSPVKARSLYAVKDSHFVPTKYTKLGPAPEEHVIELRIGVKQGDFDALEKHLYEGMG